MQRFPLSAVCWLCLAVTGCRMPNLRGPVPEALAASREMSQRGIGALESGRQPEAETLLARAVKTCPTDPDARGGYARALWQRGAKAEAIEQLEEAARLNAEDPEIRLRLAEWYLVVGRAEAAASAADQAIALNPKLAGGWAMRGRILRAAGNPHQALADFHRALGYAPGDRQILLEVAELYRQLNQPERALQTLHTLADAYTPGEEPQNVLFLQGMAYVALGRPDDGVESFSAAAIRNKLTPEILYRLAEAQWLAGRPGQATLALQQALTLEPQHQPSRELLTRIEVAQRAPGTVQR